MRKCMTCTFYWRDDTKDCKLGACDMQGREWFNGKSEGMMFIVSPGRKRG